MNDNNRSLVAVYVVTILAVVLLPGVIFAAEPTTSPAASGNTEIEEIVVTAQFRRQNLQDTPLAITAISGAMLEARSETNISQVANESPSVTLKPNSASYGSSLVANIRGIGQFDFHPALEPGVGIYVDDVYYSTLTGSILDLLDLDRVEILRGPQGTLAGKNSIGGSVKLYSKKPEGSDAGFAELTYGNFNRQQIRVGYDLGITEGVAVRMAAVSKTEDGYVSRYDYGCEHPGEGIPASRDGQDCLLSKQGAESYQAFRGQLRFTPNDVIEDNFIGDITHEHHDIAGSVLTYANFPGQAINPYPTPQLYNSRFICGRFCNYSTYDSPAYGTFSRSQIPGTVSFDGWGLSNGLDWDFARHLKLFSLTAYRRYTSEFSNEDDLSPLAHGLGGPNDIYFHEFTQELRLNGDIADKTIEYTVGGFYLHQNTFYRTRQDLRYVPGGLVFVSGDSIPAFSKSGFANATWNATDRLSVNGGLRYSNEGKDYTYRRRDKSGNLLPGQNALLDGQTGRYRGNRTDYRGAVQYRWSDQVMTYAQYSTGFKGGGVNPRPFDVQQVQPFGPETLSTFEIGAKTDLFDRSVRLNIAAFTSQYKDIQLTLNNCPQFNPPTLPAGAAFPCGLPANVGTARIKGAEFEINYQPIQNLQFDSSASYVDFRYSQINPLAGGPTNPGGVQYGMVPPYSPKWKASLGAQYEFSLGSRGSLTPRVDSSYQSRVWGVAVNDPYTLIRGYTVSNARLTFKNAKDDLQASLEVLNMFNRYYYLTAFEISQAAGVANAQPARPRQIALSVKKKF